MAKTKKSTHAAPAPAPVADDEGQFHLPGVEPPPPPAVNPSPRGWTWPARSRCPRCGSTETRRVSDDGPTQYRKCERTICRYSYKVQGSVL